MVHAMIESHLHESVDWFMKTTGEKPPDPTAIKREQALFSITNSTRQVDFLVWIEPGRLLHVEFESSPRRGLALRMLQYRQLIMKAHPDAHLSQVVLVLGRGRVDSRDDPRDGGFRLGVATIRILDHEAAGLLGTPGLEPLTMLTRQAKRAPEATFEAALRRIRARTRPHEYSDDIGILTTLGSKSLTVTTMEKLMKEAAMSEREIMQQMREAPLASRVLHEVKDEGREEAYEDLLELHFGEHERIPAVARTLAAMSRAQAKRAVLSAASIDDLPAK